MNCYKEKPISPTRNQTLVQNGPAIWFLLLGLAPQAVIRQKQSKFLSY